jgi:hypothetical protein
MRSSSAFEARNRPDPAEDIQFRLALNYGGRIAAAGDIGEIAGERRRDRSRRAARPVSAGELSGMQSAAVSPISMSLILSPFARGPAAPEFFS